MKLDFLIKFGTTAEKDLKAAVHVPGSVKSGALHPVSSMATIKSTVLYN